MNKFFRYFFPFLDEIFNSMIPLYQIPWGPIATGGLSLLGGWMGGQKGPPATTTQRIEHVRPTLTPEELAMQDFFRSQVYGRLGQVSPLQQMIESYYGGGMPGIQTPAITQQIPAITPQATQAQFEQAARGKVFEADVLPSLQRISELFGGQPTLAGAGRGMGGMAKRTQASQEMQNIAQRLNITPEEANRLYQDWIADPQAVTQRYAPTTQALVPEQPIAQPVTPTQPVEQPYTPLGAIMQQTPEQLAEQYDILRQQGRRGIEDWYQQAQREFERRGIGQYGGYMGTPVERDIGGILGQRGRMETELGAQLGLSELQARQQLPYGQLQTLEDVRRWEAQNLLQQQAPWIGVGQQMYALPWGQTTTATQQTPGPGIIPGAISGAYTGAGLYGMGQNLGWWGQQRTPYGGGMVNIPATYGGSPSGYEGSMPGYAY